MDIEHERFDLVVIGAGINGAGIARDAALRGLKVLVLDKGDIGGGTTSWSTRLIHGGLRYLEHGELHLVRESLRERERLLRLAPHLVRPLPMLIPVYERGERGWWTIRAGMIAYDLLSFDKTLSRHHTLSRKETLERAPGLDPKGLRGASLYYDAQVEYPERLALENALSARDSGARIMTYARVEGFHTEAGRVRAVEFTDLLTSERRRAHAEVYVNVAGPWVDEVLKTSGLSTPTRLIGGTKGSHVVVNAFTGAPRDALYVEAEADGRPFFIIPWNDLYLIGTTDKSFEGNLDSVRADEDEIAYLTRETNRVIPRARLTREQLLYTYSGVRPLPYNETGPPNAGITRRHFVRDHAPVLENFVSIVGGKLTTFRNLSEQAVTLVFKKLGRAAGPSVTMEMLLPGAKDLQATIAALTADEKISTATRRHLLRVYGSRAAGVLRLTEENPELKEVIDEATGAIGAEVLFAFQEEMARSLTDCLMRRTMIGLGPTLGRGADELAARLAAKYLGWDDGRARKELAAYRSYLERFLVGGAGEEVERADPSLSLHT